MHEYTLFISLIFYLKCNPLLSGCISDANFSWVVSLKEFAHPALEIFSAVQSAGPTFFLAIAMFAFVFQISALITEKELKLRQVQTNLHSDLNALRPEVILGARHLSEVRISDLFFTPFFMNRL